MCKFFVLFLAVWCIGICRCDVNAMEVEEVLEQGDVQKVMDEILPSETGITFSEIVHQFVEGKWDGIGATLEKYILDLLFSEICSNKIWMFQLIGILLISAVFNNFSTAFTKSYVSETGFYLTYMLVFVLLISSFTSAVDISSSAMENMIRFMSALVPLFCLATTLTGNIQTGIWYQQAMVGGITLVEWMVSKGIISLIHIYVLLSMINQLSKEDLLSKFTALLKIASEWTIKTVVAFVLGIQWIQSIVLPAYEMMKNGWTARLTSAIPGVGDAMSGVFKTVLGSAMLIKKGIGSAGIIVLTVVFVIPMLKLVTLILMYLAAQAVVQPIADRRMVNCIHSVSEGVTLLLKVEGCVFLLFVLSLAMMTAASVTAFGG